VLSGLATLEDALQPWGRNAMWVLASGPLPPNPSEVLGSHQMIDLLKSLDDRADVVVFDSPPLLPVTDAAVLARLTDGAVLVVRHGTTRREQVTRALEALQNVDAKLLGTVLNRAPAKGPDSDSYGYAPGYYTTRGRVMPAGQATPTVMPGRRAKAKRGLLRR
jgi:non-specific protein-tyrosine kinase